MSRGSSFSWPSSQDTLKPFDFLFSKSTKQQPSSPFVLVPPSDEPDNHNHQCHVLKQASVREELLQFKSSAGASAICFPDYFSPQDQVIVRQVAHNIGGLEVHTGQHNSLQVSHGRSNPGSKKRTTLTPILKLSKENDFGRENRTPPPASKAIPKLACLRGKEHLMPHLTLVRTNSASGKRTDMLWEVIASSSSMMISRPKVETSTTNSSQQQREEKQENQESTTRGIYPISRPNTRVPIAMFKPTKEEHFVREGLETGEGAVREEAAYVLDHVSKLVPPTAVAALDWHDNGHESDAVAGSLQRFIPTRASLEDIGCPRDLTSASNLFSIADVHQVGLLDLRLFNTDRHFGNILLRGSEPPYRLVPIDHGCILPSWFHLSEARLDWQQLPQASVPFTSEVLDQIERLDVEHDALLLRQLGLREECIVTMILCTIFVQASARGGKSLKWMAQFVQRSGCLTQPSQLEHVIQQTCVRLDLPFCFRWNEYQEACGWMELGILSRRPPAQFVQTFETFVVQAIHSYV